MSATQKKRKLSGLVEPSLKRQKQQSEKDKLRCAYDKCKFKHKPNNMYCGNHIKLSDKLEHPEKYCTKKKCVGLKANGFQRCQKCINNGKKTDSKRKRASHKNKIEGKCCYKKCGKDIEDYKTKSGKKPTKCRKHYEEQRARDEKRPKRNRDYNAIYQKRKKDPKRIAWKKNYQKTHRPWIKYRKKKREENKQAFLKHNREMAYEWRKRNPEKFKKIYERHYNSVKRRLHTVKWSAKYRGKTISVSDEKLKELLSDNECFYCGMEWDRTGIDRVDNKKGYEIGNIVTCCKICNIMKGKLEYDSFIKICKHIASVQGCWENEEYYPESFDDYNGSSFDSYKQRANKKKLKFELTFELFDEITKQPCYLCDKMNDNKHGNGIDRIDNDLGYILENIAPCCGTCNYLKNAFKIEEVLKHCKLIASNF